VARRLYVLAHPALLGLLVCLGLSVAVFWHAWQDPSRALFGSGAGDGALMLWFLRWTPKALSHGLNPLFTDHLNYPSGVNVMWNTSLLLPGLILAPLTTTFGPVVTYNVLCTLALGLSAWTAALAFRRYVKSPLAALIGGLTFGFSPYMLAQDRGHLQQSLVFMVPLLFLALDNILVGQRRSPLLSGALFGVLAACQVLIGEEVFATTMIVGVALVLVLVLLFPRQVPRKAPYAAVAFGAAAVAFLAIAGWPLWFQVFGPQHITGDITGGTYGNDLWNLVTPTGVQAFFPEAAQRMTARFTSNLAETDGFMGIPLILIVVFTVARWAWSSAVVRVAFLVALVPTVLSLGARLQLGGETLDVKLPWNLLQHLPLLESAVPNRLMLQAMLFYGLLLALFIDRALRWAWAERVPALLLVVAAMVALAPRMPAAAGRPAVPSFFTSSAVQRVPEGSVVLVVPMARPRAASAMVWQAFSGLRFRMPAGYFVGPLPDGRPHYGPNKSPLFGKLSQIAAGRSAPTLDPDARVAYTTDLFHWNVRTVVIGPMHTDQERGNARQMLTELLGRPPSDQGGVDVWWDVQPRELLERARTLR
jgi:hypothetical protein